LYGLGGRAIARHFHVVSKLTQEIASGFRSEVISVLLRLGVGIVSNMIGKRQLVELVIFVMFKLAVM
jgi:hypothetical protein